MYADVADGVAVTRVEQSFFNPLPQQIEGIYIFPLPDESAVSDFSMTAGGKTLKGEVLDAETARRTYEEIVRRTRDPGLLEYMGGRLYRASIFPIPPHSQLDVKLQYSQVLSESGGLGVFRHPFKTDEPEKPPIESLTVQVKLKSALPLTSVFCPSHRCDISRASDFEATATFEQSQARPDRDFLLYYQRKDAQFGLSLLTHRGAGEPGYFLVRISPRVEVKDADILPKDIAFVVDTSGSMQGGKIEQARRALKFCINALSPKDRFNVYTFSTEVHPFREALVAADADVKAAALGFADKISAMGGTNINQALLAALAANPRDAARPYLIVFVTDGEPTVDVTDPERIVRNVEEKNPGGAGRVRIHVLGVGSQVNTHLLDKLAAASRGSREYCTESEDLELKLSGLAGRLASPVLTDISLRLSGLNTFDLYPREMPDLFRGSELLVVGRYDGEGRHAVELTASMQGSTRNFTYEGEFPKLQSGHEFLPRLWATRRVGYLLDQIRLHGRKKELVDEVVALAKRHGIVTEFTSALILEDEGRLASGNAPSRRPAEIAQRDDRMLRMATEAARRGGFAAEGGRMMGEGAGRAVEARMRKQTGGQAVADSRGFDQLQGLGYAASPEEVYAIAAPQAPSAGSDAGTSQPAMGVSFRSLRQVMTQTLVHDGSRWVDTTWDGKQQPRQVVAFSDEYFELLRQKPRLARYFAQGPRVLVVLDGEAYETIEKAGG